MVLKTLESMGTQHGYGIAQRLLQVSEQLLQLNQGTLYPALLRLEQRGWISSKWGTSENNRRARFYTLTRAGPEAAAARGRRLAPHGRRHGARALAPTGGTVMSARELVARGSAVRSASAAAIATCRSELPFHREMLEERHRARGLDPGRGPARRAARARRRRRRSPRRGATSAACRCSTRCRQDIRYGVRMLRRAPGLHRWRRCSRWRSASAPTPRSSPIVDAVLLRPLPYRDPDRLVTVGDRDAGRAARPTSVSRPCSTGASAAGASRPWR